MDPTKADCLCLLARAHHALGNMNEAYKYYTLVGGWGWGAGLYSLCGCVVRGRHGGA